MVGRAPLATKIKFQPHNNQKKRDKTNVARALPDIHSSKFVHCLPVGLFGPAVFVEAGVLNANCLGPEAAQDGSAVVPAAPDQWPQLDFETQLLDGVPVRPAIS